MTITGIDRVTYGVADLARVGAFFTDWGLAERSRDGERAVFETADGAEIVLAPRGDKTLPRAIQRGSTVREMTWGVDGEDALAAIGAELARDREVSADADGTLHAADPMGLGIAFRLARRRASTDPGMATNTPAKAARIDRRSTYYDDARPRTIGHCVFMAPDIGEMERFYTDRLGFRVSDYYTGRGVFLRCAPRGGHHNLFFLESADGKPAINHVAFGVRDIHELFAGGNAMAGKGWKTQIGPGRHRISSCYFWYFDCPAGGAVEYFHDEDYLTESWRPGHWDPAPETFAEWVLAKGLSRSRALPPTRETRDAQ